jgi:hypothetical protein
MQIEDKRKAKAKLQATCNFSAERNSSIHFCKLLGQCPSIGDCGGSLAAARRQRQLGGGSCGSLVATAWCWQLGGSCGSVAAVAAVVVAALQ